MSSSASSSAGTPTTALHEHCTQTDLRHRHTKSRLWTVRPISAASYHPATEWSICASAISTPRQLAEARSSGEDPGKRGVGGGNRWRPGFTGRGSEEDDVSDVTAALDEAFERRS